MTTKHTKHHLVDIVTDQTLRDLAHGGAERQFGVISNEDQAILSMILPDLCGELMAHRAAMRAENNLPYPLPRNHAEEIANARAACAREGTIGGYNV